MSGIVADLLIDTDVFIDHLRGSRRIDPGHDQVFYSVITRCELYAGGKTAEAIIQRLLEPFEELPVDRVIAERAGRLRRSSSLRTPHALIAATAMEHQLVLMTRNARDFQGVGGLKVRLPRSG